MKNKNGRAIEDRLTEDQKKALLRYAVIKIREDKRKRELQGGSMLEGKKVSKNGAKKSAPNVEKSKFYLHELLSLDVTEIPFLVEGILPKYAISFLAGPSDVGKSTWYTQLCMAIISGKGKFLDHRLNSNHKRALIVNTEDGSQAVTVRLKKQLCSNELTWLQQRNMMLWTDGYNLVKDLEAHLVKTPVDLIAIDSFSDVFTKDMNSSNDVRNFLADFVKLIEQHKTTILFVHHTGKSRRSQAPNKDQMLGSVGIESKARHVLMLENDKDLPNIKKLYTVKSNYMSEEEKNIIRQLMFYPDTLRFIKTDDTVIKELKGKSSKPGPNKSEEDVEQAWRLYQEYGNYAEVGRRMGVNRSTIKRWLEDYVSEDD